MKNCLPSRQAAATELLRRHGRLGPTETATDIALNRFRSDPGLILSEAGITPDPWQEQVLRSGADRLIFLCSRQSGKSTTAAALALKVALLEPDRLVLILSPGLRQSGEMFRDKVLRLYNALNRPVATEQLSRLEVTFANGSRIVSLPGEEGTIRGYSGVALLIIDEAARVPDELYFAVRPMIAVSRGRVLLLSTPYGRQGFFAREWHDEEAAWERVRVTADQCPRISPEFLASERRLMGGAWYDREYGCSFEAGVDDAMFPGAWLDLARKRAAELLSGRRRRAVAMGVDPGEGSAFTVWVLADEYGVVARHRERTANTAVIPGRTVSFIKDHDLDPSRVLFDRGGGGREHADRLRALGYEVESVGFGEAPYLPIRRRQPLSARQDNQERHYAFKNLRAQMYWQLRQKLDPSLNPDGFGIPGDWVEVFEQLGPVPVWYDGEERLFLPPKRAKSGGKGDEVTMAKLVGCSPDDSDALVLACHALIHGRIRGSVGVL